jgi:peroxiredoxin Q/BCP
MRVLRLASLVLACAALTGSGRALAEIQVGDKAPEFKLPNQDGVTFDLASRRGKGWTVLYFYPKAGTPGCTDQACAFRDSIKAIREKNAEVYGISADTVDEQREFHAKHKLSFDLLADPDDVVIKAYDAKYPVVSYAKRWTFILDPELVVRFIDHDVDPVLDAKNSAAKLAELQQKAAASAPAAAPGR